MALRIKQIIPLVLVFLCCGCNPISTGASIGMKLVGKGIDDAETSKLADELVGKNPSAADQKLGQPEDIWRDVYSTREWRSYHVKMDVLNKQRIVVECAFGQIVKIQMIERYGEDIDYPLEIVYLAKAKGKTPSECQKALELGAPLLTVRSEKTHTLLQIYDTRMIKELSSPHDCFVRYDQNDRCNKVDLVEVQASSN